MRRVVELLVKVGLVLGLIGAIGQSVLMLLDLFIFPKLRWYWGGSIAYFAAPVAFALTAWLLGKQSTKTNEGAR
jgi:hypothetical protein